MDVPWSPYDVDGRNFEWLQLAESADIIFVMACEWRDGISASVHARMHHLRTAS